jgi:small conductance mechanosensitive channel
LGANGGISVILGQAAGWLAQAPPSTTAAPPPSSTATSSSSASTVPPSSAPTTTQPSLIAEQPKDPSDLIKSFEGFLDRLVERLPLILTGLVAVVVTLYLARLLQHVVERTLRRTSTEAHVHLVVGKMAYFGTVMIGLIVGLAIAGVNLAVLAGSIGLASVGLGFALSDILSNFIAGIALLLEHPFTRNDYIITRDAQGTVEDIRVRATVLRTPDGQKVLIPNKLLFTDVLTNASATQRRRLEVRVNVPYDEDTEQIRDLLLRATVAVDGVEEEPPPQLLTQDFGQGALQLMMWFWVDPRTTDMLRVRSEVVAAIERTLREADVDLAVPTLIEAVPADEPVRRGNNLAGALKPEAGPADPEGRTTK